MQTQTHGFKHFAANPDIIEHTLGDEDEFMIIACDGRFPLVSLLD
jgi:hypothetical protein